MAAVHAVYQWQQLEPVIHDINDTDHEKDPENSHYKDKSIGIAPKVLSGFPLFHRIVLMGGENVACLLGPGRHEVVPVTGTEGPTCALLPVCAHFCALFFHHFRQFLIVYLKLNRQL